MMTDQFHIHIHELIPQRAPMIMITTLVEATEDSAMTEFLIEDGNLFAKDGFLGEPGLIENIAQTAAAHAGYLHKKMGVDPPAGFIAAIKDLAVYDLPPVNSRITTRVVLTNRVFDVTIIKGEIEQGGKVLCRCEMKIFLRSGR
jgi:predicted hotdog family 3-hydroxylacyl-ACP dehydratase